MVLLHNVWYFRCVCGGGHRKLVRVIIVTHLEAVHSAKWTVCTRLIRRIPEFARKLRVSESHVCMLRDRASGTKLSRDSGFVILDAVSVASASLETD